MTKKLNWRKFIEFWSQFYEPGEQSDEKFYYPYINDLSKDEFLDKLWLWKMGVRFYNKNNQKALKIMKEKKEIIREFRISNPSFDKLYKFSKKIFKGGVVYLVFLMHICKPKRYPIFDQNVFRAFIFLTKGKIIEEMPRNIKDYLKYRDFILKISKKYRTNLRDIDKGLLVFGQFLKDPKKF